MCDFVHQFVFLAIFWVLPLTHSQDVRADFDAKYVKRCGFFRVAKTKFKI